MGSFKVVPIVQPSARKSSYAIVTEKVEIALLLRQANAVLDAGTMTTGHRIRVASRLLQHLDFRTDGTGTSPRGKTSAVPPVQSFPQTRKPN